MPCRSLRQMPRVWCSRSWTSTTSRFRWSLPLAIRLTSSRSSISRASSSTLRRISSRVGRTSVGSPGSSSSAVTVARTGVSGVRSSWLSTARNWSLVRLAASAASLAALSSCSACTRAVMSRTIPVKIRRRPRGTSLTARSTGKVLPSLRRPTTSRPIPMIFRLPRVAVVLEVAVVLGVVGLGHEHLDVPAEQLAGVVAEDCEARRG